MEYYIEQQKKSEENPRPDYDEAAYLEECEAEKQPKGFPKRKAEGKWCSKVPINLYEAKNELTEVNEKISELESADLHDRFLGIVFIVVERPSDASRILGEQGSPFLKLIIGTICCCIKGCFPDGFFWTFVRAPEPSDIYWENLGIGVFKRLGRGAVSLFGTSCLMVVCILFIRVIKAW